MKDFRVDDLIGAPFLTHGRTIETGFDCYGLTIEVCKRMGYELPDLDYENSDAIFINADYKDIVKKLKGKIKKVEEKNTGDILIFKDTKDRAVHIGVAISRTRFIHCDRFGVRILNIDYYNKKYEVYRWQE